MAIVNIGIVAHVDAGKTSLTERILFETGVIASVGSVDKGTTQTDTMELERTRGITIQSAVVSFHLHALKVNLIDTPGHADFVAEVERSLRVLDGVVLVVSSVEGVQPQTRRLARAIRAAGLPMLIFVNKIDRLGARGEALLEDIRYKLHLRVVAMNAATGLGDRAAVAAWDRTNPMWRDPVIDLLAETSERVIAEFDRTDGNPTAIKLEQFKSDSPEVAPFVNWKPNFLPAYLEIDKSYQSNASFVGMHLGYYRNQNRSSTLINSINQLVKHNVADWQETDSSLLSENFGPQTINVKETKIRGLRNSLLVWQWYWIDGKFMANSYQGKFWLAKQKLLMHGDDGAVLIFYAPYDENPEKARATLRQFLSTNLAGVESSLVQSKKP